MCTRDGGSLSRDTLGFNRYDGFKHAVKTAVLETENEALQVIATTIWVHLIKCRWRAALFLALTFPVGLAGCDTNTSLVQAKEFA